MKPFNLEEALSGKPVITRDGRKVSELFLLKTENISEKLVVVLGGHVHTFYEGGNYLYGEENHNRNDLFMAPETVTKWVNVYGKDKTFKSGQTQFHDSEQEAKSMVSNVDNYITTTSITFEI